jgi:FAD synthetase
MGRIICPKSFHKRSISQLLILFLFTSVVGEAFSPLRSGKKSWGSFRHIWGRKMEASTQVDQEIAQAAAPNWRVVPASSDSYESHLSGRSTWSEEQFQESLQLYEQLTSCSDSYVHPGIKMALNTLDHAYRLYGPSSVICSFNGGKDAVVILHLVRAAHAKYYNDTMTSGGNIQVPIVRPRVVYFNHPDEFPEVIDFLQQSVVNYDLDMVAFEEGVKFAEGLKILVDNNILQGCNTTFPMAFVLGTRSSDPNAVGQDHFAPSSHWMPPFMRVNPVLDWNYGHVWHFLRLFQLPYCSLYDEGYTSLGTTKDTLPCPALAVTRGPSEDETSSFPKFWPAYMLRDWDQERAGRIKKEKKPDKKKGADEPQNAMPSSVSALSIGGQLEARSVIMDESTIETSSSNVDNAAAPVVALTNGDDSGSTAFSGCSGNEQKTVGILIIGDEILKGMTVDQNTNAAAKALRKECVKLSRVVVVSDDQDEIVKEIRRLQSEVDVIITSGGVGPTHDDVTINSVAASLDRPMILHQEMAELLKDKMNNGTDEPLTPAQTKMATLPSNAKLRYLSYEEDDWPVLQCRNIFILPGVPEFFSKKIQNVAAYLSSQLERSAAYKVVLKVDEAAIVDVLNEAVQNHPNVTFGSYPFVSHPDYKTVVTLEGSLVENQQTSLSVDAESSFEGIPLRARNSSVLLDLNSSIIPKDIRDQCVRVALDDLIRKLPKDSILRVENDDLSPFT